MNGELLTTGQAAAALRAEGLPIYRARVAAWCRAGGLAATRDASGRYHFTRDALAAFMHLGGPASETTPAAFAARGQVFFADLRRRQVRQAS